MSELRVESLTLQSDDLTGEAPFPAMFNSMDVKYDIEVGEEAGLFIWYGRRTNPLPHKWQDRYTGKLQERSYHTLVLENDFLRAVFLPGLGGRMWALYDKKAKRNLINCNPVLKPGNLAICNQWFSGGIEWNIGTRGHHANTCRPLFAARAQDFHGTPVLRMYEFSRENGVAYQMEFFLPDDSPFLFGRMRIHNHHPYTIPMYWWTNIGIHETDDLRIIAPADRSFAQVYIPGKHAISHVDLLYPDGYDCSYPKNYPYSKDNFFDLRPGVRRFEAAVYGDGYAVCQCSTSRLQGRKLFVWGRGIGGQNWQRQLTSPEGLNEAEIQAGLARTQLECLPMPPKTAWEWLEAYGPLQVNPKSAHGEWNGAIDSVSAALEQALPGKKLDTLLAETKDAFALQPAREVLFRASGWGEVEKKRCGKDFAPQLDFHSTDTEAAIWHELIATGQLPDIDLKNPPPSYQVQDEFFELLKKAPVNAHSLLQLGINEYMRHDYPNAEKHFLQSLRLRKNVCAMYALGHSLIARGEIALGAEMLRNCLRESSDLTIAKECLRMFIKDEDWKNARECFDALPEHLKILPLFRMLSANIYLHEGKLDEAEALLMQDGGLNVPQLREGEGSLSEIYIGIQLERARRQGRILDPDEVKVPTPLDFRMVVYHPGK